MNKESPIIVEIYKLANRLKIKLGRSRKDTNEGFIAAEAVEEADKLVESLCSECSNTIGGHLEVLSKDWAKAKGLEAGEERDALMKKIFTVSHEIKDIAAMCGYDLIAYFAESLRDYVHTTQMNMDAQRVIIKAHMDAMSLAHKDGLKENGGPLAEELKSLVKVAIQKYS